VAYRASKEGRHGLTVYRIGVKQLAEFIGIEKNKNIYQTACPTHQGDDESRGRDRPRR